MHIERDIPRERLTAAVDQGAPHLAPIFRAVRDHRCAMATVAQGAGPFVLPVEAGRPLIVILGDDTTCSMGPAGFDTDSLAHLVRRCPVAIVISSGPMLDVYANAAANASLARRDVMIVETRPEHEIPWIEIIRRVRPNVSLLLSTVKCGRA